MLLQIGMRYTPLSALHQFSPTLPIIWTQVAGKRVLQIPRWCLFLKFKQKIQRPNTKALAIN
jgi:hypothetical protein